MLASAITRLGAEDGKNDFGLMKNRLLRLDSNVFKIKQQRITHHTSHGTHYFAASAWRRKRWIAVALALMLAQSALPAANPPTQGDISVAGERDVFTFTLGAERFLYFDALSNHPNLRWSLSGPQGSVVTARAFTSSDGNNISGNLPRWKSVV